MMRERIHDSLRRRLSPSRTSDRDGNESIRIKHVNVVSHGIDEREQRFDGIRRDSEYSDRREEEEGDNERYMKLHRQEDSGKHYPNRSESTETVPTRFITSHDYEYSQSHREYSDSSRLSEDGKDKGMHMQDSSPLSQVGSNGASFEDENTRLVSLDDRCCVLVNDSDRVDERRRQDYNGDLCASQGLQSRRLDDYVGGRINKGSIVNCGDHEYDSPVVSRCGKEIVDESRINYQIGSDIATREFHSVRHDVNSVARESDLLMQTRGSLSKSHVDGSNIGHVDAANSHLESCTKERMMEQCDSVKEYYPVELRSSGDEKDHHYRSFCNEERKVIYLDNQCQLLRKDNQYDGLDSRMYLDRDHKAPESMTLCLNREREAYLDNEKKAVYSDDKRQELRNDYHFGNDGRMHSDVHRADLAVDQDGRVLQLQRECLNREREAYLDNKDDKRRELRNERHFANDGRMHSDLLGADMVDQDGRVVQLQRVCSNKGKATYMDNEREDVYLNYKSQQLEKDYDCLTDARIYPNVNRLDARGQSYYRGVYLNDRKETYLQCENQQPLKDYETISYGMMHPDVNKSDILVEQEDGRGLRYRGVPLNDQMEAYFHQQVLKDHETNSYGMVHPNLNKSDVLDRDNARALERRRISFDDGKESYLDNERRDAYLRYESQQLKKDYDYGTDDRIYRDATYSDIIVHHGHAKALEPRRATFSDRNEAYLDNERKDVYQHYEKQQLKKDYYSGIDDTMYPDVTKSEIVVDRGDARALEHRGVSLNDGRETYSHHERQQLLRNREIDSYGMMHPDVSRSSARNQVYLDDERLQLPNDGHVKVHANQRYPDGRQEIYHSNDPVLRTRDDYCHRDDSSEVIHENIAYDYSYSDVKPLRMSYEKADSERFHDHEAAYSYRDKVVNYAVDEGTSTEHFRYLADERNYANADHTSTPRPRVSAKERLGGRVKEDSRVLHRVRNPKPKGKSHNRNHNRVPEVVASLNMINSLNKIERQKSS